MAKDFYNVADLTKHTLIDLGVIGQEFDVTNPSTKVLMAQVKVQLAIAQQLSVISGHLGELVEMCKKQGGTK